jgi:hypothetical protein
MAVQGTIALPPLHGVQIPETAFTDDDHSSVMVVAADGTVSTAKVRETGNDGTRAIVTGVTAGTRIVVDGQTAVGNGQKVAYK